jgi:hemin uptake protein HemP
VSSPSAPGRQDGDRRVALPGRDASLPVQPTRRWQSRELLGQAHEVEIVHGDQLYRLRLTSLGKLILTK